MESKIQRRQTERLQIRVTPATKERRLAICTATGKSQAELIRQWANGRKVVSKSDAAVLAELRRQGGLIKGLSINNLEKMLSFWYAFLQWRQAYEREIMGSV